MSVEKRLLQKESSFYEDAMQQIKHLSIFNQSTMDSDFHCHIFWFRYIRHTLSSKNPRPHYHSFFELICNLNGSYSYQHSDQPPQNLSPGRYLLTSPQSEHILKTTSAEAEIFAIAFNPIFKDTEQGNLLKARFESITNLEGEISPEECQLIELIMQELNDNRSLCSQNIKSLLEVLIITLTRKNFEKNTPVQNTELLCDPRIITAKKYLEENTDSVFTVAALAQYLNLSVKHLNHIIQSNLGISAKEFIDRSKSNQAKTLLLETDLSIQTISEMLGFSDHNNFNRFFKRTEGLPPRIFRLSKEKT